MGNRTASRPLSELVDAQRGISYGIVQPGQHVDDGVPIIRVTDIRDGRINSANPLRVAPDIAAKYRRTTLRGRELLLTLVGTVGETAIVPEGLAGWNTARAVAVIPVQATLNLGDVSDLPIPMPDRGTRECILEVLGTLDDKIELNRQTNETLEAMARALFKSWFVDFDPVRAKAEGRQPSGMDSETAKLFPSEFEESELGKIPKGWKVSRLGDLLELKPGYDLPAGARQPGPVPIVSSSGPSGWHNEAKVKAPGVVTGRYGTIGQVFLVREDFWPLNTTLYLRDCKGNSLMYCYYLLSLLNFSKFSDKAAVPGINRNHVREELMVHAPAPIQERFSGLASGWFDASFLFKAQDRVLCGIRDALLPRLLSGELSVGGAERVLEAQG